MQEAAERTCDRFPVQVGGCGGEKKGTWCRCSAGGRCCIASWLCLGSCEVFFFSWRESSMC